MDVMAGAMEAIAAVSASHPSALMLRAIGIYATGVTAGATAGVTAGVTAIGAGAAPLPRWTADAGGATAVAAVHRGEAAVAAPSAVGAIAVDAERAPAIDAAQRFKLEGSPTAVDRPQFGESNQASTHSSPRFYTRNSTKSVQVELEGVRRGNEIFLSSPSFLRH